MCLKSVILFNCGHTRLLDYKCEYDLKDCPRTKRVLIPEEGGVGIEVPMQKDVWKCVFKCVPGTPSHDPLIDIAKEDVEAVKANIEHQVEVLSVLSTPANTPSIETGGFNFNGQSSANRGRKRSGLTPCSEQTKFQFGTFKSQNEDADRLREEEKVAFKFSKDKMKIPAAKLVGPHSEGSAKCEEKSG